MGNESSTPARVVIETEAQAWQVFQDALHGEDFAPELELVFSGWPVWQLHVRGHDWHSTVPTRVMAPLLEVQRDLNRAFARMQYGAPNLNRLTREERDALELVVRVAPGSSEYEAPLYEQLSKLAAQAIKKMESRDIVIAVVGVALVWGSTSFGKAWLAERQQQVQTTQTAEIVAQLSREETARLKEFAAAERTHPPLQEARGDVQESQNRLLKVAKPHDKITISGVAMDGATAATLTQQERAHAEDVDVSGYFRVQANDATQADGYRVRVARLSDGEVFTAMVPLDLADDQQKLIQEAEWSKGTVLVWLRITASLLHGKITNATVYRASREEEPEE